MKHDLMEILDIIFINCIELEKKVTICFRILWILALIVAAVGVILWIVVASIVVPQDGEPVTFLCQYSTQWHTVFAYICMYVSIKYSDRCLYICNKKLFILRKFVVVFY